MQFLYFTIAAVVLYFFSDWLLRRVESLAGRQFEQRSIVFFAIFLGSLLIGFALIRHLAGS